MWQTINLFLWLAIGGATFAPGAHDIAKSIAVAGLITAACAQHSAVRGFFRRKRV